MKHVGMKQSPRRTNKDLQVVENILYKYNFYIAKIKNIDLDLEENDSEKLVNEKLELENKLNKIDNVLNCLDEKSLSLIKARYFERYSLNKLSESFNMSVSSISVKIKKILNDMKIALDLV
jgi:RNA polymerase sigma factor (sigma-70 family)